MKDIMKPFLYSLADKIAEGKLTPTTEIQQISSLLMERPEDGWDKLVDILRAIADDLDKPEMLIF